MIEFNADILQASFQRGLRRGAAALASIACCGLLSHATLGYSDVLAPEEYVVSYNLSLSLSEKSEVFPSGVNETIDQLSFTHSLTGLLGLGLLPWQHHLYASAALKSIERVGRETGLEFADVSTIDTKIALQHLLFDYQPQYAPYGFELSIRTGLNLPTTPEGYRVIDSIPNPRDEDAIETTFDKGTLGIILGLNLSGYYSMYWSDLELGVKTDMEDRWQERSATLGFGASVSQAFAIHTSYGIVSTTEFGKDSGSSEFGLGGMFNLSQTWSAGAGAYRGFPQSGGSETSFYVSLRNQSL